MKIQVLRVSWRVLRLFRAWDTMDRLRCNGSAPADCWFPAGSERLREGLLPVRHPAAVLRLARRTRRSLLGADQPPGRAGPWWVAVRSRASPLGGGRVVSALTATQRAALEEELQDRFEDAATRWVKVCESPHYPLIMSYARKGAWSMVSMLLQEIWEGTDR